MCDLIDRSKLSTAEIKILGQLNRETCQIIVSVVDAIQYMIDSAPTVDAVEVVRCENCLHWRRNQRAIIGGCFCECLAMCRPAEFYCAYGKKEG